MKALLAVVLAGGLLAVPGGAAARPRDDAKPKNAGPGKPRAVAPAPKAADAKPAADGAAKIVGLLHNARVTGYETDLQTSPLPQVLNDLSKRFEVTFVIDKRAFGEEASKLDDAKASNLSVNHLDGQTLHAFLSLYLRGLSVPDVTYLVREDYIELTTREAARQEAGLSEAAELADGSEEPGAAAKARARQNLPLVSVVSEDRPFPEVFRELVRVYNLSYVIDEEFRGRLTDPKPVCLRLLNVPADTALELLAEQVGMGVTRKGNTFRLGGGNGA